VIFQRPSIAAVSGKPWEHFQLNHLVFAFLVAARFADPVSSLPPYQFARDTLITDELVIIGTDGNIGHVYAFERSTAACQQPLTQFKVH